MSHAIHIYFSDLNRVGRQIVRLERLERETTLYTVIALLTTLKPSLAYNVLSIVRYTIFDLDLVDKMYELST